MVDIYTYPYLSQVLHPRNKTRYFKVIGWEPEWIETAVAIVRHRWEVQYADVDVGVPSPHISQVRFYPSCNYHY